MTAKLRRYLALPITAVAGVAISFLLRGSANSFAGFTVTSPKATYYIGVNVVYFWGCLGVTAGACLLLWRRARRLR